MRNPWSVVLRQIGLAALAAVLLPACAPPVGQTSSGLGGAKGEIFGYRQWISPADEQDVVVIGIHGFCGASVDYSNLGDYLMKEQSTIGLYAYELRGQGSDPLVERRGDIGNPADWYRDLRVFSELVRQRHPDAKLVWFGESMGALIAVHALNESVGAEPPCDALVLSSPIVRFRDDIPSWTPGLVQVAATAMPLARISLETLMAGGEVQMTQTSKHGKQAKKNSYHVDDYTLRLLATLSRLVNGMNGCASEIQVPVLVLHGGRDYFNNDADLRGFVARLPETTPVTYKNYPKAYHLLMYDQQRQDVFRDVVKWLDQLKSGGF